MGYEAIIDIMNDVNDEQNSRINVSYISEIALLSTQYISAIDIFNDVYDVENGTIRVINT